MDVSLSLSPPHYLYLSHSPSPLSLPPSSIYTVPYYTLYFLSQVLEDECEQYREDISFLQSCLDGEHDFISATFEEELKPEPTLQGTCTCTVHSRNSTCTVAL